MTGWTPLRPVEICGIVRMRRDLSAMDPEFLEREIVAARETYLATFWRRNASLGLALWDREEIVSELDVLLLEEATRFDGRGTFVGFACARQRQRLIDVSRRVMGRRLSDANARAAKGETLTAEDVSLLAAWSSVRSAEVVDDWRNRDRGNDEAQSTGFRALPRSRFCTQDGCERVHHARGLCRRHYLRAWHAGGAA